MVKQVLQPSTVPRLPKALPTVLIVVLHFSREFFFSFFTFHEILNIFHQIEISSSVFFVVVVVIVFLVLDVLKVLWILMD